MHRESLVAVPGGQLGRTESYKSNKTKQKMPASFGGYALGLRSGPHYGTYTRHPLGADRKPARPRIFGHTSVFWQKRWADLPCARLIALYFLPTNSTDDALGMQPHSL